MQRLEKALTSQGQNSALKRITFLKCCFLIHIKTTDDWRYAIDFTTSNTFTTVFVLAAGWTLITMDD